MAYIELMRPFTLLAPVIGCISGAMIASGAEFNIRILFGALSAAVLNAASNVNNQYFDLDIDRVNKPLRPLPSGRVTVRQAAFFTVILYAVAMALAWLVNRGFFLIVFIAAAITFFYSAPLLKIRRYPFLSNIFIAVARGMLLIVAGWSIARPVNNPTPWFIGLVFALYLFGAATTKDFSDIKGDAAFGVNTLPVVYGAEKTIRIISPFFYLPFLLIPIGVVFKIIKPAAMPISFMAIWGLYTASLISRNPQGLTFERNHISWKHMYLMLIVGQIGFAIAYAIKI